MYCKECGAKINPNTKFCPECGTELKTKTSPNENKKNKDLIFEDDIKQQQTTIINLNKVTRGFNIALYSIFILAFVCEMISIYSKTLSAIFAFLGLGVISVFFIVLIIKRSILNHLNKKQNRK